MNGVKVYINNDYIGTAPIAKNIPLGDCLVSFKHPLIKDKNVNIEPKRRELVVLNLDNYEFKHGEVVVEGLPKGTKVSFNSDYQNKEITITDKPVNLINELIIGKIKVSFEHEFIQDFSYNINLKEDEIKTIKPGHINIGILDIINNNSLPTVVILEPVGSINEDAIFPELNFTIPVAKSVVVNLPEGIYRASYYKPNDDISGIKRDLIIKPEESLNENIQNFDYSISYQLKAKNKIKGDLTNKLSTIKKTRSKKSAGGWAFYSRWIRKYRIWWV